ncbi:MAG: DNA-processing protein DprA [Pseudomonadota bacterium]
MPATPEAVCAHRLISWPGLGAAAALALVRASGSFAAAFAGPLTAVPEPLRAALRACREAHPDPGSGALPEPLTQPGVFLLALTDPDYPALLRQISSPPPLLYGRGDPSALALPAIAVVGSRHASGAGQDTARRFAADLAAGGFAVVSGLAVGIDAAAHRGALDAGVTVAVLGTGIDRIYPRQHQRLGDAIPAAGGALVSEFPPGTPPRPGNFPRRNRIIAGLSLGVLVVEAALRSGSLITARQALEQGREVCAVPGSIHNPLARGCHQLIREGATLVETVADVVAQLGGLLAFKGEEAAPAAGPAPGGPAAELVLSALGHDPAGVDLLVARTGLDSPQLTAALVELELAGLVEQRAGTWLRRR